MAKIRCVYHNTVVLLSLLFHLQIWMHACCRGKICGYGRRQHTLQEVVYLGYVYVGNYGIYRPPIT